LIVDAYHLFERFCLYHIILSADGIGFLHVIDNTQLTRGRVRINNYEEVFSVIYDERQISSIFICFSLMKCRGGFEKGCKIGRSLWHWSD
jgi:hypothetical protein